MLKKALYARIKNGIDFFVRNINQDGGIPAVKLGDPSGCWTTAEAIESFVRFPGKDVTILRSINTLVKFQLQSQLKTKRHNGGWPLVVGGLHPSSMATAHSVIGLVAAKEYIADAQFLDDINDAVTSGVAWLKKNKNANNGGWGLEPSKGESGKESRVVSTFLAIRALAAVGDTANSSRTVREAVDFLWSLYTGQGFSPIPNEKVEVCATVRAFLAISSAKAELEREGFVEKTIEYVVSTKPAINLWELSTESYIQDGAPGQIVFNNNTTMEVLDFLVETDSHVDIQLELVDWFQHNQDDDGSWCLGANDTRFKDLVTWPTNEVVLALSKFLSSYRFKKPNQLVCKVCSESILVKNRKQLLQNLVVPVLVIVAIFEGFLLLGPVVLVQEKWNTLPEDFRGTFFITLGAAITVNFVSAVIISVFKKIRTNK